MSENQDQTTKQEQETDDSVDEADSVLESVGGVLEDVGDELDKEVKRPVSRRSKKYRSPGRPTKEQVRLQQLTDAISVMAKAQERQAEMFERFMMGRDGKKEQSREVDPVEEYRRVAPAVEPGEPAAIYKSGSRGLRLVLRKSKKVYTGDDYDIIPPLVADFDNATYRTSDPDVIALLDAHIDKRRRLGKEPKIVKVKDEIAEALQSPDTDKKPVGDGTKQVPEIPEWAQVPETQTLTGTG